MGKTQYRRRQVYIVVTLIFLGQIFGRRNYIIGASRSPARAQLHTLNPYNIRLLLTA